MNISAITNEIQKERGGDNMKTDIEIAQEAKLEHIRDVAATIGIQ